MARVFWSDGERDCVAGIVFPMSQNNPGERFHRLVNRAMEQLPRERQRPLFQTSADSTIVDIQGRVARLALAVREAARLAEEQRRVEHVELSPQDVLSSMSLSEVLSYAAVRVSAHFEGLVEGVSGVHDRLDSIQAKMERIWPSVPVGHVVEVSQRPVRRHVVVVGLKGDQPGFIKAKFQSVARVSFVEAHEVPSKLPDAEFYFVMTKFIGHRWTDHLRGDKRAHLVAGGLSDLASRISKVLG